MCGISGIINFNNQPVSKESLKLINNALIHRGPDNEGYWFNNNHTVALGHRRLSILDLYNCP
jgi:asparagine synthase (glutamine-hydrolysing)